MITPREEDFIKSHAYVPEHLPGYGSAISRGKPYLIEDYICYQGKSFLIFVGYPLNGPADEKKMNRVLQGAVQQFQPSQVSLLAPAISATEGRPSPLDAYYKIDLGNLQIPPKVRNMIRRAGRELKVERGQRFSKDHQKLVYDFLQDHPLEEGIRHIFQGIPSYLSSVPSAFLFDARDSEGTLTAFDIGEFGARDYAFYMFNFRSRQHYIPGASDLLLQALVAEARGRGKSFVNLGLGINEKVRFFKRKWGGVPFLPHQFLLYRPSPPSLPDSLLQRIL
jgi:hypothetical protein